MIYGGCKVKKNNKKWMHFRHKVVWKVFYPLFAFLARVKYGARVKRFKSKEPCVILFNHVTAFDQFFVGLSMGRPVYFVASEDLFSKGLVSKLLTYVVAPIPIKKHSTDLRAMKTILQVAKEGGSIALSPEGNRTYSGRTIYMKPSIANLAGKLKLPIVLYKIDGGFGVQPRWSDVVRKGKMTCGVSRVIPFEEYKDWSEDRLYDEIKAGLYVDEARNDREFRHKRLSEFLERVIYVCPECGLSGFESRLTRIKCLKCGREVRYGFNTELTGEGFEFPFKYVADWYEYQNSYVNKIDINEYIDKPLYVDEASLFEVVPYSHKIDIARNASVELYGDRVRVVKDDAEVLLLPFSEIVGSACMGNNKLNFDHKGKIYQIKGDVHFNPVKYVNFYNRYLNVSKGDENAEFLGL